MLATSGEHERSLHTIDVELGQVHDDLRCGHAGCEVLEDIDTCDSGADEAVFAGSHARPLVDQRPEVSGCIVDRATTNRPIRRQVAVG